MLVFATYQQCVFVLFGCFLFCRYGVYFICFSDIRCVLFVCDLSLFCLICCSDMEYGFVLLWVIIFVLDFLVME